MTPIQYTKECWRVACARISQKSTTSAWLSLVLAAGKTDYVDLNMDLIEGRVRYRKGKKVRLPFEFNLCKIQS